MSANRANSSGVGAAGGAGHLVNTAFDPDEAVHRIHFSRKPKVHFQFDGCPCELLHSGILPELRDDPDPQQPQPPMQKRANFVEAHMEVGDKPSDST